MITDVAGVRVGHWTAAEPRTGCTAVVLPAGTVASGEVRGGAPGTREFALLDPSRMVDRVDVVMLSGGSAFGLAACDGAVRWCEERGLGFPTAAGVVPIVVGMVIYDLAVGDASVRPDADTGYAACQSAVDGTFEVGQVGAGTGATAAKWWGPEHRRDGGLGTASVTDGDLVVSALVVANPLGDLVGRARERPVRGIAGGPAAAGAVDPAAGSGRAGSIAGASGSAAAYEHTTIGVLATNARLDTWACHLVAQSAHDGLARAIEPAHLLGDGDAFVAAATGELDAEVPVDVVRILAARAVEAACVLALA